MSSKSVVKRSDNERPRDPVVDGNSEPIDGRPVGSYRDSTRILSMTYVDSNIAVAAENSPQSRFGADYITRIWVDPAVDFGEKSQIEKIALASRRSSSLPMHLLYILPTIILICSFIFSWWFLSAMIPSLILLLSLPFILQDKIKPSLPNTNSFVSKGESKNPIANQLTELLTNNKNDHAITGLIRRKYIDMGEDANDGAFFSWVQIIIKIFTLNPNQNPDLVPLMSDDADFLLGKIQERVNVAKEKADAKELEAFSIKDETDEYRKQLNLEASRKNSERTLELALKEMEDSMKIDDIL